MKSYKTLLNSKLTGLNEPNNAAQKTNDYRLGKKFKLLSIKKNLFF